MIGEPTIDPGLGDRRRKALLAALQSATGMNGLGGMNSQGLPAYGAVGRGSVSGFGIRPVGRGGAHPRAILNFLSLRGPHDFALGRAAYQSASSGLGNLIANPQAPTPIPPQSTRGGTVGTSGGSVPTGGAGGGGSVSPQQAANALNQENPGGGAYVTPTGSVFEGSLPAPSNYDTPGSGWIPLGGGMFLDPDTGVLHGSGGVSGGLRA